MPHNVDIDGIHKSLFLLQNLCHASRSYCATHRIHRYSEAEEPFDWNYYRGWLKFLVCEHLIQCSTRLRIIQDMLREHTADLDFSAIDTAARAGLDMGSFHVGTDALTLREACNKIIHATDVTLDWADGDTAEQFEYWTGSLWLHGTKGRNEWKVELKIPSLCTGLSRLLDALEESTDWHHLYKYDE